MSILASGLSQKLECLSHSPSYLHGTWNGTTSGTRPSNPVHPVPSGNARKLLRARPCVLQAIQGVDLQSADPLGSLHSCLEAYAIKVLPAHAQRANLHFDCFKALATEKGGDQKLRASGMFSWQASQKPSRARARARAPAPRKPGAAPASLDSLVAGMAGKLEAIFVAEDD